MSDTVTAVARAMAELDLDGLAPAVEACLAVGVPAWEIVRDGLSAGILDVGGRFEGGEYYLADLVLAGELFTQGMERLEPHLSDEPRETRGTVVLATVKGDVHDIGKSIVARMLTASGFHVIDLGVDVAGERIVAAVREHKAGAVGLSSLLTTTVERIRDVVTALDRARFGDVPVAIGGACTSRQLADELGADGYAPDAASAITLFQSLIGSRG